MRDAGVYMCRYGKPRGNSRPRFLTIQDTQTGLLAASRRYTMHRFAGILTVLTMAIVLTVSTGLAQEPAHNMANGGPYKVLKTARVGGGGNWDYIYADAAGRRLYIPRRGAPPAAAAGAAAPATD